MLTSISLCLFIYSRDAAYAVTVICRIVWKSGLQKHGTGTTNRSEALGLSDVRLLVADDTYMSAGT